MTTRHAALLAISLALLLGCGERETKYRPEAMPKASADQLSLVVEHVIQEDDQLCFRVALRNDAAEPVDVPMSLEPGRTQADAFVVTAAGREYRMAEITNHIPAGRYDRWGHQMGNYHIVKNLAEAKTKGSLSVPGNGVAKVEWTFVLDPELDPATPWTLTLAGATRGGARLEPITVAVQ